MYTERYVAFADILGFTNIVKETASACSPKRQEALVAALAEAGSYHPSVNDDDDFQFQTFSDSIVMSSAPTTSALIHIFGSLIDLSINLLRAGLLIRGAVARGQLHHKQNIMFGPAFLEAYSIESRTANYPRIVLSREVHEDFRRIEGAMKYPQIRLDNDGPPFLHVLGKFRMLGEYLPTPEFWSHPEVIEAQQCQSSIQNLLDNSIYEPSHFEKLQWLAVYWNGCMCIGTNGHEQSRIRMPITQNRLYEFLQY